MPAKVCCYYALYYFSYAGIAQKAFERNRRDLASALLVHEVRSGEHVSILYIVCNITGTTTAGDA